jgi:hypothetical protein
MGEIINYYNIYNNGAEFATNNKDFVPSDLHYKKVRSLIDKEARFMFAKAPDIKIKARNPVLVDMDKASIYQNYIDEVLKKNHFNYNIVKAAKDCFIGKRIAIICNFSEEYGITINFVPSLEFVYETDSFGNLTKIVCFFSTNDENNAADQRIYKKKYWIENKVCFVSESIYDGNGKLIETIIEDTETLFDYIPAMVIINDGLTGDTFGESEVRLLQDYESYYSKISNLDIDSERNSMNPIKYVRDMSPKSTENLSIAPGAFWDLSSEITSDNAGDVGILESSLNYSAPLESTLDRIKNTMYEQIDMPAVSSEDLQGIVTSGKTLKAIYWSLIVRCDEKFLAWKYALEYMIKCLIDGAELYPTIANNYINEKLPELNYTIDIVNNYPLYEDEADEKTIDLSEVNNQTMSKKAYMKKWRNLTEDEVNAELQQIALERQMLEDSYFPTDTTETLQD